MDIIIIATIALLGLYMAWNIGANDVANSMADAVGSRALSVNDDKVSCFNSGVFVSKKSSLRLFSRFESFDVWDVRWDNIIAAKVNDFLNVNLTFLLIYEKDQSVKTQIKEALQLGFTYTLF